MVTSTVVLFLLFLFVDDLKRHIHTPPNAHTEVSASFFGSQHVIALCDIRHELVLRQVILVCG